MGNSIAAEFQSVEVDWKRLRRLRRLSTVPRWAVVPTIRRQNVAEHTFHVIWITEYLLSYTPAWEDLIDVYNVLLDAGIHEEAEAVSGDISAPYKRGPARQGIKDFEAANNWGQYHSDFSAAVIKVADFMEALLFLCEEKEMGNRSVIPIYGDVQSGFIEAWADFPWDAQRLDMKPLASEFFNEFRQRMSLQIHPSLEA